MLLLIKHNLFRHRNDGQSVMKVLEQVSITIHYVFRTLPVVGGLAQSCGLRRKYVRRS